MEIKGIEMKLSLCGILALCGVLGTPAAFGYGCLFPEKISIRCKAIQVEGPLGEPRYLAEEFDDGASFDYHVAVQDPSDSRKCNQSAFEAIVAIHVSASKDPSPFKQRSQPSFYLYSENPSSNSEFTGMSIDRSLGEVLVPTLTTDGRFAPLPEISAQFSLRLSYLKSSTLKLPIQTYVWNNRVFPYHYEASELEWVTLDCRPVAVSGME